VQPEQSAMQSFEVSFEPHFCAMSHSRKLDRLVRTKSSVVETSKGVLIWSNLSDKNKLCKFFMNFGKTLTSAVNIALTGL